MSDKTTIIFLGTPSFSCPFLEQLAQDERFSILATITQEDKPQGRKKVLTPPPVKTTAEKYNIEVFQPERINKDSQLIEKLQQMQPDFLLVIAFGQLLNSKVLAIPQIKPINIHGSILPKYRGASPIEQALLNGDTETGLSIMEMALEMDAGPVYTIIRSPIGNNDTDESLRIKLSQMGAQELPEILLSIKSGQLQPQAQNEKEATFCTKITREEGEIKPKTQTAQEIYNRWRAFFPWPGIYMNLHGKQIKILKLQAAPPRPLAPGQFQSGPDCLYLGCLEGCLEILELQLEGKKPQDIKTFLSGNRRFFE